MATEPSAQPELDTRLRSLVQGWRFAGRYRLESILGRGAMGVVWRAHDETLDRPVALKFLVETLVHDPMAIDDLKHETRRSLELTHHNIVRVYDFVDDAAHGFVSIAMEFFPGRTLGAVKVAEETRCFPPERIAPWLGQLCDALTYAHEKAGVVHRDLKPQNLMLDDKGELKVTDFGIARVASESMTRISVGTVSGTPAYMSPQQAQGYAPTIADDIYAIGATLYELLTSRPPFYQGNVAAQLVALTPPTIEDRRLELTGISTPIPPEWEEVIAACLAKEAVQRPARVGEIAERLGLVLPSSHFHGSTSRRKPLAPKPAEPELPIDAPTLFGGPEPDFSPPSTTGTTGTKGTGSRVPRESKAWRSLPPAITPSTSAPAQAPPSSRPAPPPIPAPAPAVASRAAAPPPPLPVAPPILAPPPAPPFVPPPPVPPRKKPIFLWLSIAAVLLAALAFGIGAVARHLMAKVGGPNAGISDILPNLRSARTLQVPGEFPSIQAAIEAARPGDTVLINPGTYAEDLALRDGIRLQGTSAGECRITPPAGATTMLLIRGIRGCSVENLTFDGGGNRHPHIFSMGWTLADEINGVIVRAVDPGGPAARAGISAGARLWSIDGASVEHSAEVPYLLSRGATSRRCAVEIEHEGARKRFDLDTELLPTPDAWPEGIVVANAEAKITGCTVNGAGGAGVIVLGSRANAEIVGNRVLNSVFHGISLIGTSTTVLMRDNEIRGNKGAGIRFENADGTATGNTIEDGETVGIFVTGAPSTPVLQGNQCRNHPNSGIYFEAAGGGSAQENVCEGNGDCGIVVTGANTAPTVSGNRCFTNKKNGIFYSDGSRGLAEKNIVERNGFPGICVQGKDCVPTLRANVCRENQQSGILFNQGGGGVAENNECEGNVIDGIAVAGRGSAPRLTANICRQNQANGISLSEQAAGRVEGNTCEGNGSAGIAVDGSTPLIKENTCSQNKTHGIFFAGAARGSVTGNKSERNGDSGLAAFGEGTAALFTNNETRGNVHYGIYFGNGADGEASGNTCEGNQFSGIGVANSGTRPSLADNRLVGNQKFGIESFSGASPRIAADNTFTGNRSGNVSR